MYLMPQSSFYLWNPSKVLNKVTATPTQDQTIGRLSMIVNKKIINSLFFFFLHCVDSRLPQLWNQRLVIVHKKSVISDLSGGININWSTKRCNNYSKLNISSFKTLWSSEKARGFKVEWLIFYIYSFHHFQISFGFHKLLTLLIPFLSQLSHAWKKDKVAQIRQSHVIINTIRFPQVWGKQNR